VSNKKIRTLVIFIIAILVGVVASRAFNWFVATYYSDVPIYIRYIYFGLVLVPPFWAGFKFMDAWGKPRNK